MKPQGLVKTPEEFAADIVEFASLGTSQQTDLLAYYFTVIVGNTSVSGIDLQKLRTNLHLSPHANLPVYLSNGTRRTSKKKGPKYVRATNGYTVERAYRAVLESKYFGRPAAHTISKDMRSELKLISDPHISAYLTEAVSCFEYGLFRAAIVLTWCVVYSRFRDWVFQKHLGSFNAATATWKSPATIVTVDDFQDLNEATVIDTARKAGLLSKELHKTLKYMLDQRNSYAHPSSKPIRSSIAEAYIETTFQEAMAKFN